MLDFQHSLQIVETWNLQNRQTQTKESEHFLLTESKLNRSRLCSHSISSQICQSRIQRTQVLLSKTPQHQIYPPGFSTILSTTPFNLSFQNLPFLPAILLLLCTSRPLHRARPNRTTSPSSLPLSARITKTIPEILLALINGRLSRSTSRSIILALDELVEVLCSGTCSQRGVFGGCRCSERRLFCKVGFCYLLVPY